MKSDAKSIRLQNTPRAIPFPYRVQTLGYVFHASPVGLVRSRFGEHIELCIRLKSYDAACGSVTQVIHGQEYRNTYPHVLIKQPGASYTYREFPERDVIYVIYDQSQYGDLKPFGIFEEPYCWNIELTPELEFFVQQLRKWMNTSQESGVADRIDVTAFHLLSELLLQRRRGGEFHDPVREMMSKIDSYFQFHVTEPIDFDDVAASYGFSRSTFFRHWSQYNELPPAKYLLDLKLREACRRLTSSADKVYTISEMLNFRDTAYFCAVFRKKYGMTPAEYRKCHQYHLDSKAN